MVRGNGYLGQILTFFLRPFGFHNNNKIIYFKNY